MVGGDRPIAHRRVGPLMVTEMKPLVRTIDLPSGPTLQYVEHGDPTGLPVVMLHGLSDSWRSFELVLPHLPDHIRAIALTQRGHGDADRPATGYRTRDFAADVAALVDALDLGAAVIVGHSLGSVNAARFAIDYPERTLGLVLAGAFASFRDNPGMDAFETDVIAPLADPIDPQFVRAFQESTLAQPIPSGFLDAVVNESRKVPARVWRAVFDGLREDDVVADLARITAPTLVAWGDRDTFALRGDQDALLAAIADSQLVVYEGAGHALHWEKPARFAADLFLFTAMLPMSASLARSAG